MCPFTKILYLVQGACVPSGMFLLQFAVGVQLGSPLVGLRERRDDNTVARSESEEDQGRIAFIVASLLMAPIHL